MDSKKTWSEGSAQQCRRSWALAYLLVLGGCGQVHDPKTTLPLATAGSETSSATQGPAGPTGPTGATGAVGAAGIPGAAGQVGGAGAAGAPGTDNHIVTTVICNGTIDSNGVGYEYYATVFAAGDVYVNADVYNLTDESTVQRMFAAKDKAAVLGDVVIKNSDVRTGELPPPALNGQIPTYIGFYGWDLSLDRATLVLTVKFGGPVSHTWTMAADHCTEEDYK